MGQGRGKQEGRELVEMEEEEMVEAGIVGMVMRESRLTVMLVFA